MVLVRDSDACATDHDTEPVYWLVAPVLSGPVMDSGISDCVSVAGSVHSLTVSFPELSAIPAAATLVLDQPTAVGEAPEQDEIALTIRRWVPASSYLWAPVVAGIVIAATMALLVGAFGIPDWRMGGDSTVRLNSGRFWTARLYATGAWTFKDSWATNITAAGTAIVAILAASNTLGAIFPTVDMNPFITMNVVCGGIVAAAPLLFGVVNFICSRKYLTAAADAAITIPGNADPATISMPAGASIVTPAGATVTPGPGGQALTMKAGGTIAVPAGGVVSVQPLIIGGNPQPCIAIPGGTDIGLRPDCVFSADGASIAGADLVPVQNQNLALAANDSICVTGGAKITVVGVADVVLPSHASMSAPGRLSRNLQSGLRVIVPSTTSNLIVADMRSLMVAAALTTFGIGAEIWMITILAGTFSDAVPAGQAAAWPIAIVIILGFIAYAVTATKALANPKPGSSLSAEPGTSFTL